VRVVASLALGPQCLERQAVHLPDEFLVNRFDLFYQRPGLFKLTDARLWTAWSTRTMPASVSTVPLSQGVEKALL
jgi:hypothetical protein